MEPFSTVPLKIDFAQNPLGDFLSGHYPSAEDNAPQNVEGLLFKLYIEPETNKWSVHGISEIAMDPDTEALTFAGQVSVADEETLFEWFPEFSSWLSQTLPRDFKLH